MLIHVHIHDNEAHSPRSAPYGPVEFNSAPVELIFNFFTYVVNELGMLGVRSVTIKDVPSIFRPSESAILQVVLINLGFQVKRADVASTIVIRPGPLSVHMSEAKQKKLRKAVKADLKFHQLPHQQLDRVYQFIATCRAQKNYSMSLTAAQVSATVEKFPQHFYLFGVFHLDSMVAACISVLVSDEVLYTFYSIHHSDFEVFHPSVLMTDGIYSFAQQRGLKFLDLGTSSPGGVPSFGILNFKRELGALPSSCITYEKVIL